MNEPNDAIYVFDLDGVITNPQDTSVDEVLVSHIGHILQQGGHVAVNTGRSFAWVQENLITRLSAKAGTEVFERLYIVCEKGGESRVWQDDTFASQPSRFALDTQAAQAARHAYDELKDDLNTMFWDATKQTMVSIEKYPQAGLEDFKAQQTQFVQQLKKALSGKDVRVDGTTIAIDVESPLAGKHAGAELIYAWVAPHTAVEHDTFICFGDSVSDYEMARYFAQQGATTTFVYVGKPSDTFDEEPRVTLVRTAAMYSAGTREYFGKAD